MHFQVDRTLQRRYILAMSLTSLILIAEIWGGIVSGSLALLSDAAHVFMDIFALVLSFLAMRLAARPPDERHSYGWHRAEVIAALVNGSSLVVMAVGIWVEAYKRFRNPLEIRSTEMLIIAVIGLVVNLAVAFILGGHAPHGHEHGHAEHEHVHAQRENLNLRSAFLHVLGDAISSVGVIVAAMLIRFTGANWLDPFISILIGAIIVTSAWRILRSSLHILLEGVPEGLSLGQINKHLSTLVNVVSIHDLHIWNLSSESVALSAHITLTPEGLAQPEDTMNDIKALLDHEFNIQHTTIQFEKTPCQEGHGGCN